MEKFDIGDHLLPPLSKEDTKKLFESYQKGDQIARNKLIEHNLKSVYFIVYKNFYKSVRYEEIEDLLSIGTIALIKAVETYDLSKNFEFSTYSVKVIFNEILIYLRTRKKWNNLYSLQQIVVDSHETPIMLQDMISDQSDFVEDFFNKCNFQQIIDYFSLLDEREKDILILYFGLNGNRLTQKEISIKYNISQSFTSRIVKKAIKKLQNYIFKSNYRTRKKD